MIEFYWDGLVKLPSKDAFSVAPLAFWSTEAMARVAWSGATFWLLKLIGLTVMMGISAAGPLTGVALNPARAFGPALFLGDWRNHWVMWLGPVIGAALGAFAADALQPKPLEIETVATELPNPRKVDIA